VESELLKWGVGGIILVAVFWKFIPSLFEFLSNHSRGKDGSNGKQKIVNDQNRDAIAEIKADVNTLEQDIKDLRADVAELSKSVGIAVAILKRVEVAIDQ